MQLFAYLVLLLSAVMGIAAVDVQKSFLVSFSSDAPDSAVAQASTPAPVPLCPLISLVRAQTPIPLVARFRWQEWLADSSRPSTEQKIIDAKGTITHEYSLIKGFAATAGEKVYESMQVWVQSNGASVEEDQSVQVSGGAHN